LLKNMLKEKNKRNYSVKWSQAKSIILKNETVKNELKLNKAEYKIIEEIIMARKEKKITQKDLAE